MLTAVLHATNNRREPVILVAAHLSKPAAVGTVSVEEPKDHLWGRHVLLPGAYVMAMATFHIHPPIAPAAGGSLTADVVIVDNLGGRNRCRGVVFAHE
jgi:hypothetical protein